MTPQRLRRTLFPAVTLALAVISTIAVTTRSAHAQELYGVADLHAHLTSHLGFGGVVFHGKMEGPHDQAFPWCTLPHGVGGISLQAEGPHYPGGYPQMDAWPRWNSRVHQQAHIDSIRRAHQGGLRLIVMYAVNNELMGKAYAFPTGGMSNIYPTDDKSSIDRQLAYMKDVAARNSTWMEIAYSPADARRIIGAGKLAVVLGTEVDALGNWRKPEDLPTDPTQARAVIRAELERLFNLGIRQIIPIHFYDNAFGGAAAFNIVNEISGLVAHGRFFDMEPAPTETGIRFRLMRLDDLGKIALDMATILFPADLRTTLQQRYEALTQVSYGQQNKKGLTMHGRIAIEEMMRLGILIDVDHMSDRAANETLNITEQRPTGPYPVISSHTGFRELAPDGAAGIGAATEANKSAALLERIRRGGGMAALIVDQGMVKNYGRLASGVGVINNAAGSTRSFAQSYLYLKEKMGGRNVALGTDININWQIRPRFGTYAAPDLKNPDGSEASSAAMKGQARAQTNGVRYTTPLKDVRAYRWDGKAAEGDDRFVWEGVALGRSINDIDSAEMPVISAIPVRSIGTNYWIKDVAKGVRHAMNPSNTVDGLAPLSGFLGIPNINVAGGYNFGAVQRGAFCAMRNIDPGTDSGTRDVYYKAWSICRQFEAMNGNNPAIPRSVIGNRDFDFNLDGMAHYGMLWDFLVDLKNIGMTDTDLYPLNRSAEHYVQTWSRAQPGVTTSFVPYPPPPGQPAAASTMKPGMSPSTTTVSVLEKGVLLNGDFVMKYTGAKTVTLTVTALDSNTNAPLQAEVRVGTTVVGQTGVPFSYTFRVSYVEGQTWQKPAFTVVKPGYPDAAVPYTVNLSITASSN